MPYALATPEDLAETVKEVEALDRRILAVEADVRDAAALRAVVDEGVAQLGSLDIVLANAGILILGSGSADEPDVFRRVVEVNLTGVYNTVHVAAPNMIEQGAAGRSC